MIYIMKVNGENAIECTVLEWADSIQNASKPFAAGISPDRLADSQNSCTLLHSKEAR